MFQKATLCTQFYRSLSKTQVFLPALKIVDRESYLLNIERIILHHNTYLQTHNTASRWLRYSKSRPEKIGTCPAPSKSNALKDREIKQLHIYIWRYCYTISHL